MRLPDDQERLVLQDLEARQAVAIRKAAAAADRGDLVDRDRWLGVRRELNREQIEYADQRDVFWVKSWSDREILRAEDVTAPDISWLTHVRGIDGTTIHRAQGFAIEQALQAAQTRVSDLLTASLTEGAPLPLREAQRGAGLAGGDVVVVQLLGDGLRATYSGVLALVRAMRVREYAVQVGPIAGDDWIGVLGASGLWVMGPRDEVERLMDAARGLYGAVWAP